ncbi:NAD binding Rossmann fold oxidoreductase [Aspergillus japonicus CBS 114.51]|uniref:NAD binding Rossmann fold oxidoreductase n=1 Tax=Aspergillus japonicus CBS 114.51 TaxID=1448312 RepID=A0A8T8X543_ASPJA|nr:NAD binding Rossmann fold oxidoreductase [Aspergillus japonicus CBS 114.51]RAH83151.1 NAD binding Rossmann fold oxidoreductase [Aspergillus japonicus CBS 114.51]
MTSQPRLKLALIGLGRLGAIRAEILAFKQPRIELVAACDTKPGADEWAAANLPASVKFFADPEDCMKNSGAEAVLISTATATHAPLIIKGLDLGLHVMCEKPISVDVITTEEVLAKAASKPHLRFLVPFCRRYDESYRQVKQMVQDGALGDVHAVESSCLDQQDPTGFFVRFSEQSGGIFVDMGVHDIDIGRYYLDVKSGLTNPKKQVNRVVAVGQQAVYGELSKYGDADNGWGLVEFANGKILTFHLGRTLTNGFEGMTRVCGTKAHSVINANSTINRVEVRDAHGVRTATTPDAFVLYDKSFLKDLEEFATACLDGAPLTCAPEDAYEAAKIATALQFSFRHGVPVYFDDEGLAILDAGKKA